MPDPPSAISTGLNWPAIAVLTGLGIAVFGGAIKFLTSRFDRWAEGLGHRLDKQDDQLDEHDKQLDNVEKQTTGVNNRLSKLIGYITGRDGRGFEDRENPTD